MATPTTTTATTSLTTTIKLPSWYEKVSIGRKGPIGGGEDNDDDDDDEYCYYNLMEQMEPISQETFQNIIEMETTMNNEDNNNNNNNTNEMIQQQEVVGGTTKKKSSSQKATSSRIINPPYFTFARTFSKRNNNNKQQQQKQQYNIHLYSAKNIIEWYPLHGITDPCTQEEIIQIEYYLLMIEGGSGIEEEEQQQPAEAIYMGTVIPSSNSSSKEEVEVEENDENEIKEKIPLSSLHHSISVDLFIWTITADDDISKMMCLLGISYLYNLGYTNLQSNDRIDTQQFLDTLVVSTTSTSTSTSTSTANSQQQQQQQQQVLKSYAYRIYHYVHEYLLYLISNQILHCSNFNSLFISIQRDAAMLIAEYFIQLDPNLITASSDNDDIDIALLPHIRKNALADAIQKQTMG